MTSNSAFLNLVSGFKNLISRYWLSLAMFTGVVIATRYLDNWAAFMLMITTWVAHCYISDNTQTFDAK